jgi:hypothetical protein
MRRLFSRADLRDLSLAMAIVLLLAGIPSTAGVVIVAGPSHPEITTNICHPIQTFVRVANTLFARPAVIARQIVVLDLGWVMAKAASRIVEFKADPQTPPPKRFV